MNPTDSQVKWFWEKCGLRYVPDQDEFKVIFPDGEWYNFGSNWKMGEIEPPIDLNNLFKYGEPMFIAMGVEQKQFGSRHYFQSYARIKDKMATADSDKSPADALFEACYKALGGDDVSVPEVQD